MQNIKKTGKRPSWDTYFMGITQLVAKRTTCCRRTVGAVIVRDKRILATGYNGAPAGLPHCLEIGCLREQQKVPSGKHHELCRGLHAEQNAILQAAYHGFSVKDTVLFCTTRPCSICTKLIINAGIRKIIYMENYEDPMATEMLSQAKISVVQFTPDSEEPNEMPLL